MVRRLCIVGLMLLGMAMDAQVYNNFRRARNYRSSGGGGSAVTFQSAAGNFAVGGGSTVTVTINAGAGSDKAAFIGISYQSGSAVTVSTVTYDGVACTKDWDVYETGIGVMATSGWHFIAPPSGNKSVVITMSGSADVLSAGVVCMNNVHQTTPVRAAFTAEGSSATASVTSTDAVANDMVLDSSSTLTASLAVGANQTSRYEDDAIEGGGQSHGISTQAGSDGGVMTWTITANQWVTGCIAFRPP